MSVRFSYNQVPLPNMKKHEALPETKEGLIESHRILDEQQPLMQNMPKSFWKANFEAKEIPWGNMFRMVASDYRCYSAGIFKEGISSNDNWMNQPSLLILDVDDGLTLDEAKSFFSGSKVLISTTRNHRKLKNDVLCDRYRVILPLKSPITCSAAEYTKVMALLMEEKFTFTDDSCKDASRMYFGYAGAEHFYLDGLPFDFNKYLKIVKKVDAIRANKKVSSHNTRPKQRKAFVAHPESTQKGFYERTWCTPEMLIALKFEEKFVSGNRNNALLSWIKFFKDIGFSDSEVREVIFYINSSGDSIEESEIEKTIFRSQRIQ